tara:strand:- start:228 stop:1373 length:1146 start_codon:yes stop_codon:yes gene_type:complete
MTKAADLANLIGNVDLSSTTNSFKTLSNLNDGGGLTNRNFIINGAMNVAQRATSATGLGGSGAYDGYNTCDRWATFFNTSGALTMSQDSSAPSGFANSLKFDCTTADTSVANNEYIILSHRIEGQNLQSFAKGTSDAKPFAVSFYVKGNASATYVCELFDVDNSRQISKTFTVSTSWARVELAFPADTTGTLDDDNARSFDFNIWLHAGSDYTSGTINSSAWASYSNATRIGSGTTSFLDSTDRTFFLTGVQLEIGQNFTEFEHEPIERTLLKCERYYQRWQAGQTYDYVCNGSMATDTRFFGMYQLSPDMRDDPTMNFDGTYKVNAQNGDMNASNFNLNRATKMNVAFYCDTSDADRVGNGALFRAGSDADAFIEFISEL